MATLASKTWKAMRKGASKPLSEKELLEAKAKIRDTSGPDKALMQLKERFPRLHQFMTRESDVAVGAMFNPRNLLANAEKYGEAQTLEHYRKLSKKGHEKQ